MLSKVKVQNPTWPSVLYRPKEKTSHHTFLVDSDAVIPSGMFPGDDGGALALRSVVAGGKDKGPDCVSCVSPEVLFVILEVATVLFFFFEVLLISLYKPHE